MKLLVLIFAFVLTACSSRQEVAQEQPTDPGPEAYTLDGVPLFASEPSMAQTQALDSARSRYEADPSEENLIWYGRRMAYLQRYGEALEIFTRGIESYPDSYRLYRHRGHRYISVREFRKAADDLQKAAELAAGHPVETEPDGIPNRLNIPLSNTQFNIYYHLGLAHYLLGDWSKAEQAYLKCMEYSVNDDLRTATSDWLYMTYIKMGDPQAAQQVLEGIHEGMNIIENDSYYMRLLMYKGMLDPSSVLSSEEEDPVQIATQGYGVGNFLLSRGDTVGGMEVLKKVTSGQGWSAFGFIAAEADLYRHK